MKTQHKVIDIICSFLCLIRPFTLLAPLIVSISIMIASFYYQQGNQHLAAVFFQTILPASFSLAIMNGASNALNQATDYKTDTLSKPYRPIPRGILSVAQGKRIAISLYIISVLLAYLVHPMFLMFVLSILFFTVTYSLFPRMKDKLFFNQVWIALPRGFLGILASWSVFSSVLQPIVLIIAIIAALFLFGGSITKDIADSNADWSTGTKTLVNTYGVKKAAVFSFPFMFFPFLLVPLAIGAGLLPDTCWTLTFLAIPGFYIFTLLVNPQKKHRFFENTSAWAVMYATYFIYALMFSSLSVIASVL